MIDTISVVSILTRFTLSRLVKGLSLFQVSDAKMGSSLDESESPILQ